MAEWLISRPSSRHAGFRDASSPPASHKCASGLALPAQRFPALRRKCVRYNADGTAQQEFSGAALIRPEPTKLNTILTSVSLALLEPPHGLRHYLRTHFLDKTFQGLYQANGFDLALLIPYFIVLILLAFYGMHRYQLV